jgi:putative Holliday junction resolvase
MPAVPNSVLALDVGNKRVGIALASLVARLPQPLTTLERGDTFFTQLTEVIDREGIGEIVVGWPRGLNGQSTAQTAVTEAFTKELSQHFANLSIHKQDEALTSKQAESELQARGKTYGRGDIDALAACYILADWLAKNAKQAA